MASTIKRYIIFAIIGVIIYFLVGYHYVIMGREVKLLKKSELTLENTFVNIGNLEDAQFMGPEHLLMQRDLREAGIGEILVEKGVLTEEELEVMLDEIDEMADEEDEDY